MPVIGQQAPELTLMDHERNTVVLSEHRGQPIILAFYPAAFTGVCTTEFCTLTERMGSFEQKGAKVYGISVDSPFANKAFAEASSMGMPLLSDVHREVTKAYGVELQDFVIPGYTVAQRSVFIIDGEGILRWSWIADNPGIEPDYEAIDAALDDL